MRDYINISSVPYSEDCAQVGSENYVNMSRIECSVFKDMIIRTLGEPPIGACLTIKTFNHDFGSYKEIVVYFDDTIEESWKYAFNIEANAPEKWDAIAMSKLKELGYKI